MNTGETRPDRPGLMIPSADPVRSYLSRKEEIDAAVARVTGSGRYILGPELEAFEAEFAAYVGVKHCVGVASGTDALRLAVQAACPDRAGAVTVSMTATATVAALVEAGFSPALVDILPDEYTMNPAALEGVVPGTVIVPVHLYGRPCRMEEIIGSAKSGGAVIIEDCAQAHGAFHAGFRIGSFGSAAAFSFYPTKNLGALGDGGAVVTDSEDLAGRLRLLRMYGWHERYVSEIHGINSRLDELQAAVLRVKLRRLDEDNARRVRIAARYDAELSGCGLTLPPKGGVYHQYVIRHSRRGELRSLLADHGVGTAVLYPVPVHRQPGYAALPHGSLPVTERLCRELLCLPIYPELTDEEVERVCHATRESLQALY